MHKHHGKDLRLTQERIHANRWLVQDEQLRFVKEGGSQGRSALLSTAEERAEKGTEVVKALRPCSDLPERS